MPVPVIILKHLYRCGGQHIALHSECEEGQGFAVTQKIKGTFNIILQAGKAGNVHACEHEEFEEQKKPVRWI